MTDLGIVLHDFDFEKKGNRGDMRKIYVTWQFFEARGIQGYFFKKTKNLFLDEVDGSMCTKFQFYIVFRWARRRDTNEYIHKYTSEIRNILDQLLTSRGF